MHDELHFLALLHAELDNSYMAGKATYLYRAIIKVSEGGLSAQVMPIINQTNLLLTVIFHSLAVCQLLMSSRKKYRTRNYVCLEPSGPSGRCLSPVSVA